MKATLSVMLAACCSAVALAQDHAPAPLAVDAKVVVDNAFVQVLRMSIPAHFKTPMHEVTPRVVVWLSEAHFVDYFMDGNAQEERRRAGDVEWVSARRHAGENLSDKPMEFVAVVFKIAAAGAYTPQRQQAD